MMYLDRVENPFSVSTYEGPEYFCDRNQELSDLIDMFDNGRHGLLFSMRRLGKTGLIHHFHHFLSRRTDVACVYCDMQDTRNDSEFVKKLIDTIVGTMNLSQKGVVESIGKFFASLRPVISINAVTGSPSLKLTIETPEDVSLSIEGLARVLESQGKKVQIALDEFQQIAHYEEPSRIDATLRGHLSMSPNVHLLFCGSQRHILLELFSDASRPLYSTVEQLQLQPLDTLIYREFIVDHFQNGGQKIENEIVEEILQWTRGHTFHTQYFCNKLYADRHQSIGAIEIEQVKNDILFSFETSYLNIRSVLSQNQYKVLRGIAREGHVTGVNSAAFLSENKLAQSSASQALDVLVQKEIVYRQLTPENTTYFVYDPFFTRWLETK